MIRNDFGQSGVDPISLIFFLSACRPASRSSGVRDFEAKHISGIIVIGEIKEKGILDAQLQCLVATNQVPYALPCLVNEDDGNFWLRSWDGVSGDCDCGFLGNRGLVFPPHPLYLALSGQTAWLGTSPWDGRALQTSHELIRMCLCELPWGGIPEGG